jgi:hypothetical protein
MLQSSGCSDHRSTGPDTIQTASKDDRWRGHTSQRLLDHIGPAPSNKNQADKVNMLNNTTSFLKALMMRHDVSRDVRHDVSRDVRHDITGPSILIMEHKRRNMITKITSQGGITDDILFNSH